MSFNVSNDLSFVLVSNSLIYSPHATCFRMHNVVGVGEEIGEGE